MLYHPHEPPMTDELAQQRIAETIRRHGRFILSSFIQPEIGDVQLWAGLPMRCVRYVTKEEAIQNKDDDLWGKGMDESRQYHFEVEVAD